MNLAYRKSGSDESPAVVLIHGFCESKDLWTAFEAKLATFCQVISLDLPGFGESTANTHYDSMDALAQEVHILLEALHVDEYIVIAHSLGGYVALALAEAHPQSVLGLGLFHSTAYADSEEKQHSRDKTAAFIEKNGVGAFLENFVPSIFYKERHAELKSEIDRLFTITRNTPLATAVAVTKAMRDRPNQSMVLKEADFPILFIAGKEDTAVPLEANKEQFFLPKHATIHLLAETGHMGMFEWEKETLAMVEDFVRRSLEVRQRAVQHK